MPGMRDEVVAELMRLQAAEGMNAGQFAAHIGIDPGEWSRLRRGERKRLGPTSIARIARIYSHISYLYAQSLTKASEAVA